MLNNKEIVVDENLFWNHCQGNLFQNIDLYSKHDNIVLIQIYIHLINSEVVFKVYLKLENKLKHSDCPKAEAALSPPSTMSDPTAPEKFPADSLFHTKS